jgi:uncharacterized protein involved in cysteine biosynthesis
MACLPRGLWAIVVHRSLWAVVALPLLLNIVFVVAISEFAVPVVESWLKWSTAPGSLASWTGWWRAPADVLAMLGYVLRALPGLTVPLIVACLLSTPPFRVVFAALSPLVSEAVERLRLHDHSLVTNSQYERRERTLGVAVTRSLLLILLEATVYVVTLPLALVPLVGTLAWVVFPRAIFAGADLTDPTLCRKGYTVGESARLFWTYRYRFLGLGTPFFLLLGVPYVNAVIFPVAAVAATLLYLELERK